MTKIINRHNPDDESVILPRISDYPKPSTKEEWWPNNDIHTPILIGQLLRGDVVAFGDPGKAGAPPEWIAPRLWKDLVSSTDTQDRFEGAGNVFWNVRVIPADEFASLEAVNNEQPEIETNPPERNKGGRPVTNNLYPFVAELVRFAHEDNMENVLGVRKHMLAWCAKTFVDGGPSDSTVKSWTNKMVLHLKP